VLDYDREAETYDESRGGEARAKAAADAVERLLPPSVRTLVDVACGTGIVTARLAGPGRRVLGVDRSASMLARAAARLPRSVALGDATCLPVGSGRVDAVVLSWLLHLLRDVRPVLAEAARVLRPGGVLITTVDKVEATFREPSDIAALTEPMRRAHAANPTDGVETVTAMAAEYGLRVAGRVSFLGAGQGRSPRQWREAVLAGRIGWARRAEDAEEVDALCRDLTALPEQDCTRPDPRYELIALS
jgi:ubiquinone/menaquinone biosynthesis C-methylase UbiE